VQDFALKFQAVAEKTSKYAIGLLYFAASCSTVVIILTNPLTCR